MIHDETDIGGHHHGFPTTHWNLLDELHGPMTPVHREVLNLLIRLYWKPVYCYLRSRGYKNEQAKDLVQEFFTFGLGKDLFGRADRNRGRFRTFLLASLNNFVKNRHRDEKAECRHPVQGIVSLEDIAGEEELRFEPSDKETPEVTFQRVWAKNLLMRVLKHFEAECSRTGKETHYAIFAKRIVAPLLEGAALPSLGDLGTEMHLAEKEVSNRLITARRAFQRLLRKEVQTYAASPDDEAEEVRDLFEYLGRP